MSRVQHIDYDALHALKDVMENEFGFLIDTFIQDSSDRLEKLQALGNGQDVDAVRRAAHSFKGSCSNLGAVQLANLCAGLESKMLECNLAHLMDDINNIEAEFLTVKKMMFDFLK